MSVYCVYRSFDDVSQRLIKHLVQYVTHFNVILDSIKREQYNKFSK